MASIMLAAGALPQGRAQTSSEDTLTQRLRFGWLGRSDVQEFLWDLSQRVALPRDWLEKQFRNLGVQPRALLLMYPPPPPPGEPAAKKSWARYLAAHVGEVRVSEGYEFLRQHRNAFHVATEQSGVPANIIAAIIGVETRYGKYTGNFPALETLTTLAFESPRRTDFFKRELESLLIMGRQGVIDLKQSKGSYAGALGLPQFMPSSWRSYAQGYQRKDRADLINNPRDAIVSVGNFLKVHGWKRDEPSHSPVITDTSNTALSRFIAPRLEPLHTVAELHQMGAVQIQEKLNPSMKASLIDLPEEDNSVRYWMAAHNFFVITQYNRSFMYAAAVLTLADALADTRTARSAG